MPLCYNLLVLFILSNKMYFVVSEGAASKAIAPYLASTIRQRKLSVFLLGVQNLWH